MQRKKQQQSKSIKIKTLICVRETQIPNLVPLVLLIIQLKVSPDHTWVCPQNKIKISK